MSDCQEICHMQTSFIMTHIARELAKTLSKSMLKIIQYGSLVYCTLEFVADFVVCSGPSMQPAIQSGDIVLTEHISVIFNKIQKGDIVICKSPKAPKEYICKRVVAMEGDHIVNTEDSSIINIKRGHIWLEGDNKTNSIDSRSYGQVPYGLLRGRVFFVLWPFDRIGSIDLSAENKGI